MQAYQPTQSSSRLTLPPGKAICSPALFSSARTSDSHRCQSWRHSKCRMQGSALAEAAAAPTRTAMPSPPTYILKPLAQVPLCFPGKSRHLFNVEPGGPHVHRGRQHRLGRPCPPPQPTLKTNLNTGKPLSASWSGSTAVSRDSWQHGREPGSRAPF